MTSVFWSKPSGGAFPVRMSIMIFERGLLDWEDLATSAKPSGKSVTVSPQPSGTRARPPILLRPAL